MLSPFNPIIVNIIPTALVFWKWLSLVLINIKITCNSYPICRIIISILKGAKNLDSTASTEWNYIKAGLLNLCNLVEVSKTGFIIVWSFLRFSVNWVYKQYWEDTEEIKANKILLKRALFQHEFISLCNKVKCGFIK